MITEMLFKKGEDPCPTLSWRDKISEKDFRNGVEKVVSFCASMDVDVFFEQTENCTHWSAQKKIIMNSSLSPRIMFYVLLHETGHMVLNHAMIDGEDHTEFLLNYPGNVNIDNKAYVAEGDREHKLSEFDRRRYAITVIHEELDAWRKGIDIAAMLQLPMNLYDYYSEATKGVESYVAGACVEGNLQVQIR